MFKLQNIFLNTLAFNFKYHLFPNSEINLTVLIGKILTYDGSNVEPEEGVH